MTQPVRAPGLELQGRVYTRLLRFRSFPAALQDDTKAFQTFLVENKTNVFQKHHTVLAKSVYSVKGKELLESIEKWLQDREGGGKPHPSRASAEAVSTTATRTNKVAGASTHIPQRDPVLAKPRAALLAVSRGENLAPVPTDLPARAREIAESLVLSGFLTPHDDDEKHVDAPLPDHYVHDHGLLVPVAKEVSELETTSVWSVLDGAIYAKALKRKAGLLAHFSSGKDVYVVFNEKTRKVHLFESDLAREPFAKLTGEDLSVQFDNASFEFGVLVSSLSGDEDTQKLELFNAGTKHLQEEFLNMWVTAGAHYREAYNVDLASRHASEEAHVDPLCIAKVDDTEALFPPDGTIRTNPTAPPPAPASHTEAPFAQEGINSSAKTRGQEWQAAEPSPAVP